MMKRRILFVIDSLHIGGAEKSLVTLLNLIDFSKYDVDLQLLDRSGGFIEYLSEQINILPELNLQTQLKASLLRSLLSPRIFLARCRYSVFLRTKHLSNIDKSVLYWKCFNTFIGKSDIYYDVAVAYAQGVPSLFVVDKVNAGKKICWINGMVTLKNKHLSYLSGYYRQIDRIVCVSDSVKNYVANNLFPKLKDKLRVIWDIIDPVLIRTMGKMPCDVAFDHAGIPVIMTVGRLTSVKGYDIAVEAAYILKEKNINFKWYVIGEGPEKQNILKLVGKRNLYNQFILLGEKINPYPYIAECDIYVQPSRREGFGLTIAEARILGKPIVCTRFEGHRRQIRDGVNGLTATLDPADIAIQIERLIKDTDLYAGIKNYLQSVEIGNKEELIRFYQLLEEDET